MRRLATALLALSLGASVGAVAQIRGMTITPDQRGQLRTGPGSALAGNSLAFHDGGTFFGATTTFNNSPHPSFVFPGNRFHHHHHHRFPSWGWGGGYPVYYGGYLPFDYGYDPYNAVAPYGYVGGTFDTGQPYPGYPYQGYAPSQNYYAPGSPAANYPPPGAAPESNQAQPSPSGAVSQGGMTSTNGSEEKAEPTVLVFRDGHKQEVANYAIMGSTLFVLSGTRTRIPIAELDVPATVRMNEDRGVEFRVPTRVQ